MQRGALHTVTGSTYYKNGSILLILHNPVALSTPVVAGTVATGGDYYLYRLALNVTDS